MVGIGFQLNGPSKVVDAFVAETLLQMSDAQCCMVSPSFGLSLTAASKQSTAPSKSCSLGKDQPSRTVRFYVVGLQLQSQCKVLGGLVACAAGPGKSPRSKWAVP